MGGATADMDFARHGIHKLTGNPEADTEATVLALGYRALKRVKNASLIVFGNADAVISNNQSRRGTMTN